MKITLTPIAYIKSEFKDDIEKITMDKVSTITLTDEFNEDAFHGIEKFSHLEIIWNFHLSKRTITGIIHPRGNKAYPKMGIFAMRSPHRPNHIATTIVKLIEKKGKTLTVYGLDAIDGAPVLDIKPVVDRFLPSQKTIQPDWIWKR